MERWRRSLIEQKSNNNIDAIVSRMFRKEYQNKEGKKIKGLFDAVTPEVKKSVKKAANETNLDPVLIFAIIAKESSFNPRKNRESSATGYMQLLHAARVEIYERSMGYVWDPPTDKNGNRAPRQTKPTYKEKGWKTSNTETAQKWKAHFKRKYSR